MPQAHYFSNDNAGEFKPKKISVTLAGQEVVVETAGSVFSPDHVDTGTKVLLSELAAAPKTGDLLDIGCGWGPIALALALANPEAKVWAIDVNERSLELTRRNAKTLGLANINVCKPDEIPTDIMFTGIWSNPPIRVGKEVLHQLLLTWLPRLQDGAESYLVVQKNLGADSLVKWLQETLPKNFNTERISTDKQFRIIRVNRED